MPCRHFRHIKIEIFWPSGRETISCLPSTLSWILRYYVPEIAKIFRIKPMPRNRVQHQKGLSDDAFEPPCCMDRRYGRTEPDPCSGLCDADVLRASQVQHSVQYVDRDGHLARLSPVRLEAQPVTDDALPSRDVSLHQSAPVVP